MARLEDVRNKTDGRLNSYTSYGCYPLFYLIGYDVVCPDCANDADQDRDNSLEDRPSACSVNWEDPDLYCDACGGRIESAYAEKEEANG